MHPNNEIKVTLVKLEENKDIFHVSCRLGIYRVCFINWFIQMILKYVRLKKIDIHIMSL